MSKFLKIADVRLKKDFMENLTDEQRELIEESLDNMVIQVDTYNKILEVNGSPLQESNNGKVYMNVQSDYSRFQSIKNSGKVAQEKLEEIGARMEKDAQFGKIGEIQVTVAE